jgi:hypothetical protein
MACSIGDAPKSRPSSYDRACCAQALWLGVAVQGGAKEIVTERVGNIPRLVDEFVAGRIEIF